MDELSCETKKESPIGLEMKHLSDCLLSLDKTVEGLHCRIAPVLGKRTGEKNKDEKVVGERATISPLLMKLEEFSRKVISQDNTVRDFVDRLEI